MGEKVYWGRENNVKGQIHIIHVDDRHVEIFGGGKGKGEKGENEERERDPRLR